MLRFRFGIKSAWSRVPSAHFCGCAASPCFLLFRPWSLPFPPRPGLCQLCQWAAGGRCQTVKWKVWESPQCENMTKISQHCEKRRPTPFTIFLLLFSHVGPSARSHGPRPTHISAVFETASCVCQAALSPSPLLTSDPGSPTCPPGHTHALFTPLVLLGLSASDVKGFSVSADEQDFFTLGSLCARKSSKCCKISLFEETVLFFSFFFFLPVAVYWSLNTFKIIHCRTLFMFQLVWMFLQLQLMSGSHRKISLVWPGVACVAGCVGWTCVHPPLHHHRPWAEASNFSSTWVFFDQNLILSLCYSLVSNKMDKTPENCMWPSPWSSNKHRNDVDFVT